MRYNVTEEQCELMEDVFHSLSDDLGFVGRLQTNPGRLAIDSTFNITELANALARVFGND